MTRRFCALSLALYLLLLFLCGCNQASVELEGTTVSPSLTESPLPTEAPTDEKEPEGGLDGFFEIHFIDVGYGDAALVICDGKTLLIDGGGSRKLIRTYLSEQNITNVDYMVCTHAHSDHVGGLSGAFEVADVGVILAPGTQYEDTTFQNFKKKAEENGFSLTVSQVGYSFSLGQAEVTILGPLKEYEDLNDTSIVLRIVYGETSFLFTGDIRELPETDLVESNAELRSTLLKVAHHGKASSTVQPFLDAVAPKYGVISIGAEKQPANDVLSRLQAADVILYRTDLQGNIICVSDGKELTFSTSKETAQ